jgi:ubiquinone/menaquinone biosynthesis C-methylase UbiE
MLQKFDPARMKRLMSADRRRELRPEKILAEIGVSAGQTFVDIGSGPGFFALPAARLVGPQGRVVGFDISPVMVKALKDNALRAGLKNIRVIRAGETAADLPAGADVYFMANTFHELEEKVGYLRLIRRRMSARSRLAIIDFLKKPTKRGPPLRERVPLSKISDILVQTGLSVERVFRPSADEYGVIARKSRGRSPSSTHPRR